MSENELLALLRKLKQRLVLAKETYPACGCSSKTIERRRVASAYLKEAEAIAKEVYDEIEIREGERLSKAVSV